MNYKEKSKEFARYVRAYYLDELLEWEDNENFNREETDKDHIIHPEFREQVDQWRYEGLSEKLEDEDNDAMFDMELITHIIESYTFDIEGAKDELLWDNGYLTGMKDAQEPIYISLTEEELQELQEGKTHEWEFNGIKVQVSTEQDLPF